MTTHRSAPGYRAISVTIAAALLALLLAAAPVSARATTSSAIPLLRQGTGMTAQPSVRVRGIQRALRQQGYHLGVPGADGRFGPLTAAAVRLFQARSGLAVDGVVGASTRRALNTIVGSADISEGVGVGPRPSVRVRRLQRMLERNGFDVGRPGADGRFGPLTRAAVRRMQRFSGLAADGIVGTKTRRRLILTANRRTSATQSQLQRRGKSDREARQVARPSKPQAAPSGHRRGATVQPVPDNHVTQAAEPDSARRTEATVATLLTGIALAMAAAALTVTLRGSRAFRQTRLGVPIRRRLVRASSGDATGRSRRADFHPRERRYRTAASPKRPQERVREDGVRLAAAVATAAWARGNAPTGANDSAPVSTDYDQPKTNRGEGNGVAVRPDTRSTVTRKRDAQDSARGRSPARDRPKVPPTGQQTVIGYVTVPAEAPETADEAVAAIRAACERAGWRLLEVVRDRDNGLRSLKRPGLSYALARITAGDARALVVNDLDRLSRSMVDLGTLMQWFRNANAALVALDIDLDTSSAEGARVAALLSKLSDRERERIGRGTRAGLAEVRARGGSVGRPAVSDRPELRERIAAMRAANMTLQAIADKLNAEGVATVRGGALWRPSSVQAALGYRRPPRPLPAAPHSTTPAP